MPMNKRTRSRLESGKTVRIFWMDIQGYINGDFNKITPAKTYTVGHVHCIKKADGVEFAVVVTSAYEDHTGDCTAIPLGCIYQVDVL